MGRNAQTQINSVLLKRTEKLEAKIETLEKQNKAQEKAILSLYNAMDVILTMGDQDFDGGQGDPYTKEAKGSCKR